MKPIPEDHDVTDKVKALDIALNSGEKLITGIYYKEEKPDYWSMLNEIKKKSKASDKPDYEAIIDTFKA